MSIIQINFKVSPFINNLASSIIPILIPFMRFLALEAEYLFYFAVIFYWCIKTTQNRRMIIQALISALAALGGGGTLSTLVHARRCFREV